MSQSPDDQKPAWWEPAKYAVLSAFGVVLLAIALRAAGVI